MQDEKEKLEQQNIVDKTDVEEIPFIDFGFDEPYYVGGKPANKKAELDIAREDNSLNEKIISSEKKAEKIKKESSLKIPQTLKTPELFFVAFIIFMELIFHMFNYGITGHNLIYKLLFGAIYGLIMGMIVSAVPKLAGKIVAGVMVSLTSLYFIVQLIYNAFFDTFLSLTGTLEVAGQAFDFTDVIVQAVLVNWWRIVLLIIPIAILIILVIKGFVETGRHNWNQYLIQAGILVLLFVITVVGMKLSSKDIYSAYEIYKNYTAVDMSVEKLGVCESLYLDVKEGLRNKLGIEKNNLSFETVDINKVTTVETTEELVDVFADSDYNVTEDTVEDIEQTTEQEIDTSPNILDLDMDELIANESNANIRAIHEYVKNEKPTNKNEYTGMFEGYNLVYIVAEGFTGYSIDRGRTPMLYKMAHEGFNFQSYYTPLWYGSTLGGEYADLTGMMPKNGTYLSMQRAGSHKNDMYFTLSRQLERKGYKVRGYHDNDYTYYDRHISHPNMGYEWIGMGNGLEYEVVNGTSLWPQSDLRMVNETCDDYKNDEPFHTYYLMVSGHVMYNFGGNAMAARHQDLVENLDYSETTKAYIACQYELELALEALVTKLEAAGVADHTLFVLTADHVPYDNKEVVDELAHKELDNTFGWYKNTLIIWSPSMEEPVEVTKHCYSLDIVPTVSNLMGLEYDSRMLVGRDIMSDEEGFIIFNDRSFMTDHMSYNANTNEARNFDGSPVDEEYLEALKMIVKNRFSIADAINENDYFRYIHEAVDNISNHK